MPTYIDPEYERVFTRHLADLWRRRSGLRRTAQDEAFGYGTRHIAFVQAAETQKAINVLRAVRREMAAIDQRRAADYLAAAAAEQAA